MVQTVLDIHSVGVTTPVSSRDEPAPPPPDDPTEIGRYTILRPIGRGGMARVYQGWDPQLDRPVAIKVLQVGRRRVADVQSRLRREAQALARLVHPNVVEVYDIEASDDSLCIVMELVEGRTLHQWLQERPPWTEVVDIMLDAARGVAAAHHAGLIHRDFKPANVMIRQTDGRVLVMDFGLARALDSTDDVPWELSEEISDDPFSAIVTRHGEVVGTPAYMSPEQQRGHPISGATDQFSFSVALFEALHGVRPFRATTRRALYKQKARGNIEHPRDTDVPRRVRAVVDRGMAVEPAQRFEDMDRLIAELERARRPARRRWTWLGAGGLAVAAVAVLAWPSDPAGPVCAAEEGLRGIWDDDQRDAVRESVTTTLGRHAPAQYDKLSGRLDDYAGAWTDAYARACEESRPGRRDAMMACLGAARSELGALVDTMVSVDEPVALASATAAAWELPMVSRCTGGSSVSPKASASQRTSRKRRSLEHQLERARGLRTGGQAEHSLSLTDGLLAETRQVADDQLMTRTMLLRGRALLDLGRFEEAVREFEAAYAASLDAGLFLLSADAATALVDTETVLGHWSSAENWAEHASSWLRRSDLDPQGRRAALGRARSRLAADRGEFDASSELAQQALELARAEFTGPRLIPYILTLGNAQLKRSKFSEAKASYAEALTLAHESYGEGHLSTSPIVNNLAAVHFREFDFAEAAELFRRAYEIEAAVMPQDDPRLAANLSNYATALSESGKYEEAEPKLRLAIDMLERQYGKAHPRVGSAWTNLGSALHSLGRLEEARDAHTTAVELMRDGFGSEHPTTADALGNLASVERALGNVAEARRLHSEVLDIRTETLGPNHASVALALNNLGDLELADDRIERARALHEQALRIYTEASGPESEGVAGTLYHLGKVALRSGDASTARDHLETSLRIRERLGVGPTSRGRTRFWLAKSLAALREQPDRARSLARRAIADFEGAPGAPRQREIREVRSWLGRRTGSDTATLRPL